MGDVRCTDGIVVALAVIDQETVEAADRRQGAGHRARRQPVATQLAQVALQLRRVGPERIDLARLQVVPQTHQVAAVGLDGILGQAPLCHQRVEPGVERSPAGPALLRDRV